MKLEFAFRQDNVSYLFVSLSRTFSNVKYFASGSGCYLKTIAPNSKSTNSVHIMSTTIILRHSSCCFMRNVVLLSNRFNPITSQSKSEKRLSPLFAVQ